jgi:hypothetical protein
MSENVVRICDYERRSREPDAVAPRDPVEADVIALPIYKRPVPGIEAPNLANLVAADLSPQSFNDLLKVAREWWL